MFLGPPFKTGEGQQFESRVDKIRPVIELRNLKGFFEPLTWVQQQKSILPE
jgi:hypothetical protein